MRKKAWGIMGIVYMLVMLCGHVQAGAMSITQAEYGMGYVKDGEDSSDAKPIFEDADRVILSSGEDDYYRTAKLPAIRSQGKYGICWAVSAISLLEINMMKNGYTEDDYSEMHLAYFTYHSAEDALSGLYGDERSDKGTKFWLTGGGNFTMAAATLKNWKGAAAEELVPMNAETEEAINKNGLPIAYAFEDVAYMENYYLINMTEPAGVKQAVVDFGAVAISYYMDGAVNNKTDNYNPDTGAYYCSKEMQINHGGVIVGWDDNYSKENFSVSLEGDGAFICQNSWGSSFGEQGFFYISYYDTNIGTHNVSYTRIDPVDNYDHIYQSDLCGWIGQLGYSKESIFGANVYTAESDEILEAISFYATGKASEYELFVVPNFTDMESLNERIPVASGKLSNAGYYTIDFKQDIMVDEGQKYAIILHMITPDAVHPLAIEYVADKATANVITDDGEGYISMNGSDWENVKDVIDCNLCIKAFSKNR